jgi:hypothetical protein
VYCCMLLSVVGCSFVLLCVVGYTWMLAGGWGGAIVTEDLKKNTVLTKFNTVLTKKNTVLAKVNRVLTKVNSTEY